MTRQFLFISVIIIFQSCSLPDKTNELIKLSPNGDTIEVRRNYPNEAMKEIVFYQGNRPYKNFGFKLNGDTMKGPNMIFIEKEKQIFAYFPIAISNEILSTELYLGTDSLILLKDYCKEIYTQLKDSLNNIKYSKTFRLKYDLKSDSTFKLLGVFKCKMTDSVYKYYPFEMYINN